MSAVPSEAARRPDERQDTQAEEAVRLALRFASRRCSNPIEAEDVAQEAVLCWLPNRQRVRNAAPWFAVVVARLAKLAAQGQSKTPAVDWEPERCDPGCPSPEARWVGDLTLKSLLKRLAPARRLLVELWLAGYKHREIARQVGCETHQVGPRIAAAVSSLRGFLEHRDKL